MPVDEGQENGLKQKWQFSLLALMAVVTGFAFLLSMMQSIPSELWIGAGILLAVFFGIGNSMYETFKKPPA
jgi:hypothetical protein